MRGIITANQTQLKKELVNFRTCEKKIFRPKCRSKIMKKIRKGNKDISDTVKRSFLKKVIAIVGVAEVREKEEFEGGNIIQETVDQNSSKWSEVIRAAIQEGLGMKVG